MNKEVVTENNATTENAAPPDEFKQVVEESKQAIQSAEMVPPKVKRGRGRPRKGDGVGATAAGPQHVTAATPSLATPTTAPDITNHLIGPLQAVSKIPAANTGIPELALSRDEAELCARSLNEVLSAFAPQGQMNPKTAAILGACVTFGSIGFSKYTIYLEKRAEHALDFEEKKEEPRIEPGTLGTVDAGQYFKKP